MPAEDLLRFIEGPPEFSRWWLVLGVALIGAVIAWCVGVFVWTSSPDRLRRLPGIAPVHARLTQRRFVLSVRRIGDRFRSGAITPAQAGAEFSRVVRSFLAVTTGARVQYLHVSEIADSPVAALARAAPLLADLNQAQYNPAAPVDVAGLQRATEELIVTWN